VDRALADTRVLFDGIPAVVLYASTDRVNAVVPYSISGRATTLLTVATLDGISVPVNLKVLDTNPGIFTVGGSGRGPGSILNPDLSPNSALNPAGRGAVISIFATGEGQTDPAGQDGRVITTDLRRPISPVLAWIGGRPARVLYAGSAPNLLSGVMQINVQVPEVETTPGNTSVVLQIGTMSSQSGVTVAIR
jgi:uncharacterized protein (TIGR03437 family)